MCQNVRNRPVDLIFRFSLDSVIMNASGEEVRDVGN